MSRAAAKRSTGRPAKRPSTKGLNRGKIHAEKATATEIMATLGVRPSELRVAIKAIQAVEAKSKQRAEGARRKRVHETPSKAGHPTHKP